MTSSSSTGNAIRAVHEPHRRRPFLPGSSSSISTSYAVCQNIAWSGISALLVFVVYFCYGKQTRVWSPKAPSRNIGDTPNRRHLPQQAFTTDKTLVIYNVHHDISPLDNLHRENLQFFLEVGVGWEQPNPLVDYLFLVPPLPSSSPIKRKASSVASNVAKKGDEEGNPSDPTSSTSIGRISDNKTKCRIRRQQKQQQKWLSRREGQKRSLKEGDAAKPSSSVSHHPSSAAAVAGEAASPYSLPPFPRAENVKVLQRPMDCLESSGLKELLQEENGRSEEDQQAGRAVDVGKYAYFVLLDSSVRGPFLPRYIHRPRPQQQQSGGSELIPLKPWTSVLTDKLTAEVKLVGRTVSCEGEMHVQAPVWATDRVGLQVLLEKGVLDCMTDPKETRERYEIAATRSIFEAGYNIDSLMLRYHGQDFRAIRDVPCTARNNPSVPFLNDGLPINPLEVVFVPARPHILASDPTLRRYTEYYLGRVPITENDYSSPRVQDVLRARKQRFASIVSDCNARLDVKYLLARCSLCEAPPDSILNKFISQYFVDGYDYRFTLDETDPEKLPYHYCEPFLRYGAPDLSA